MFRKLVGVAAATLAMTSVLGTVAAAPAQAGTTAVTIRIAYDQTTATPDASGAFQLGGQDLVGSITGTIDGVVVDATSCSVSAPSLGTLVSGGGTAIVGDCTGAGDWWTTFSPYTGSDGGLGATGGVGAAQGKWEFKAGCKGVYIWGVLVGIECYFEVSYTS